MGKNVNGGKKEKRQRRFNAPSVFRPSKDENELYAVIEKNLGNGVVKVKCIDGKERMCIVRKKFSGNRDLKLGAWILVGLREFETRGDRCDLIEVYSSSDMARLQLLDAPWHVFGVQKEENEDIIFMDTIETGNGNESAPISLGIDDINIDEI